MQEERKETLVIVALPLGQEVGVQSCLSSGRAILIGLSPEEKEKVRLFPPESREWLRLSNLLRQDGEKVEAEAR